MVETRPDPRAFRSAVCPAREFFHTSRFHALPSTRDFDCGIDHAAFPMVAETGLAGCEHAVGFDQRVRHHALAICVYRAGSETVLARSAGGVPGAHLWTNSRLAETTVFCARRRPGDDREGHRGRDDAGHRVSVIRSVPG